MLVQERCDFNYKLKDPDGSADDIDVTQCREDFEYPREQSGDGDGRSAEVYYCPLNSEFEGHKTWGVCNGGCFEDDKR